MKVWSVVIGVLFLSGCAVFGSDGSAQKPVLGGPQNLSRAAGADIEGAVLKPEAVKTAETVLIVPFAAGPGVAADSANERLALKVAQGMGRVVQQNTDMDILGEKDAGRADLIITGRIIRKAAPGRWKRYFGIPYSRHFAVEGRALLSRSDGPAAVFAYAVKEPYNGRGWEQLAADAGTVSARFLFGL
ncbi:MAG: hypothetical protein ACLFPX_04710 [Candidatus Omnitrophota bacterium]